MATEDIVTMDAIKKAFDDRVEGEEEKDEEAVVVERRRSSKGVHGSASNRDSGTSYLTMYEDGGTEEEEEEEKQGGKKKREQEEESDDDTLVGHSSRSSSSENSSRSSSSSDGFRRTHKREDSGVFVRSSHGTRRAKSEGPPEAPGERAPRDAQPSGTPAEPAARRGDVVDARLERVRDHEDNLSLQSEADEGHEGDGEGGSRRFKRRRSQQFRVGRRYSSQKMMQRIRQVVHLGKKAPEAEARTEVHPTKLRDLARKER